MTHLLVDTSVLIKWFHSEGEDELPPARALRSAHVAEELQAHILDLAIYEVGNVLIKTLHWEAADVADQLDDLHTILGPPLIMTADWRRRAATLANTYRLSFYAACWAATAAELSMPLVSADRQLLATGLAESAGDIVSRPGLLPSESSDGADDDDNHTDTGQNDS